MRRVESGEVEHEAYTCHIWHQRIMADFIAHDSKLKELNFEDNHFNFNDNDTSLIANALGSNTTLRWLNLECSGSDVFKSLFHIIYDTRSLNAIATSNHSCCVSIYFRNLNLINTPEKIEDDPQ